MAEVIVDGEGEEIPGHRAIADTDLQLAYDLEGDDLTLRVNKGPVLVFRVRLEGALKPMIDDELLAFNGVAPDFIFKIGDSRERMFQLAKGLGLDDAQLERLKRQLLA